MYNKNPRIDLRKFTRKNKSCQFGENRISGYISLPEIYLETKKKKKENLQIQLLDITNCLTVQIIRDEERVRN